MIFQKSSRERLQYVLSCSSCQAIFIQEVSFKSRFLFARECLRQLKQRHNDKYLQFSFKTYKKLGYAGGLVVWRIDRVTTATLVQI